MEQFKITNYCADHAGGGFPEWRRLSPEECAKVAKCLADRFAADQGGSVLEVVRGLDARGVSVDDNAMRETFSLKNVIESLKITTRPKVLVNWYRFDEVDELSLSDLCEHFDYIWYPSVDDIDIFDDSCSWLLSISHSGDIKLVR